MKRETSLHQMGISPFAVTGQLDSVTFTNKEVATLREALAIVEKARNIIEWEDDYTPWAHAEMWLGTIVRELDRDGSEWRIGSWTEESA